MNEYGNRGRRPHKRTRPSIGGKMAEHSMPRVILTMKKLGYIDNPLVYNTLRTALVMIFDTLDIFGGRQQPTVISVIADNRVKFACEVTGFSDPKVVLHYLKDVDYMDFDEKDINEVKAMLVERKKPWHEKHKKGEYRAEGDNRTDQKPA